MKNGTSRHILPRKKAFRKSWLRACKKHKPSQTQEILYIPSHAGNANLIQRATLPAYTKFVAPCEKASTTDGSRSWDALAWRQLESSHTGLHNTTHARMTMTTKSEISERPPQWELPDPTLTLNGASTVLGMALKRPSVGGSATAGAHVGVPAPRPASKSSSLLQPGMHKHIRSSRPSHGVRQHHIVEQIAWGRSHPVPGAIEGHHAPG